MYRLVKLSYFGIIPKLESVVQGGCQDVFAVGTELDKGDWWVVIVDQCFQTLTRSGVPDSTKAVIRRGYYQTAIAVKMNRTNGVTVSRKSFQAFPRANVPNAYALIK